MGVTFNFNQLLDRLIKKTLVMNIMKILSWWLSVSDNPLIKKKSDGHPFYSFHWFLPPWLMKINQLLSTLVLILTSLLCCVVFLSSKFILFHFLINLHIIPSLNDLLSLKVNYEENQSEALFSIILLQKCSILAQTGPLWINHSVTD